MKTLLVFALFLLLISAALIANTQSIQAPQSIQAQGTTPTPSEWIKLLTSTPDGAYRPTTGETKYPVTTSPCRNENKTGYCPGPAPKTNHILWRVNIPANTWVALLVDKGKVYVPSVLGHCYYALDQNTGEVIWTKNMSLCSMQPPRFVNRWPQLAFNLLIAVDGGDTVVLSQDSGMVFWRIPGERPALTVRWPQVFEDGDALYTTRGDNVTCYKIVHAEWPTITKVWTKNTIRGRLAYWDGRLYGVGPYSKWVSCVNASTGELIWNYTSTDPKEFFYPSPVIAYGNVYLGTENPGYITDKVDHVVCLDAKTGEYKWTFETGEYFVQSISAAYGNIYIAGGEKNAIYCLDAETGNKKWEFNAPGFIDYYTIQIGDGAIYFCCAAYVLPGFQVPGTWPGLVMAVDAYTGKEIWRYKTPTQGTSPILADGNLYVATEEDYVWCFGKGPTTTTVTVASQSLTLGQATVIAGSVKDMSPFSQQYPELQSPWVSGVSVILSYVDLATGTWTDFATVTTGSDGTFVYSWTPPSEGAYEIVARFEGNDAYYWSSAKTLIHVSPAPPQSATAQQVQSAVTALVVLVIIAIVIGIVNIAIIIRKMRK